MKSYNIFTKLSGGPILVDPVEAEDIEDIKRRVLERASKVREEIRLTHPDGEIEEVEIYELVKVAVIDFRPRVTT